MYRHLLTPPRLLLHLTILLLLSQINHYLVILCNHIFRHTILSLPTHWLYNNLSYHQIILKLITLHIQLLLSNGTAQLMLTRLLTFLPLLPIQFTSISSIVYYSPTLMHPSFLSAMNSIHSPLILVVLLIFIIID